MTLYKALQALIATDYEGDFSINFPEGFPIESGEMGFSGATFADIAMLAPDAFTLEVTNISIVQHRWEVAEIDTAYGKNYIGNLKDTLMGDDEPLTIEDAIAIRGINPMVDDVRDLSLRECDEIAKLADTDIYAVIEALGEMVIVD